MVQIQQVYMNHLAMQGDTGQGNHAEADSVLLQREA